MSGDPLRDLNGAARIHIFGDARRTEAVTTNFFQDPGGLRPFLDPLQDTPPIRRLDSMFHDSWQRKEKGERLDLKPGKSVQAKGRPIL